jgi:hypothetical protein
MNLLFEFILSKKITEEEYLNDVLAGYWAKLVINLLNMKPRDMMDYLLTQNGIMSGLFKFFDNESVFSIVQNLYVFDSNRIRVQPASIFKKFGEVKVKYLEEFIENLPNKN